MGGFGAALFWPTKWAASKKSRRTNRAYGGLPLSDSLWACLRKKDLGWDRGVESKKCVADKPYWRSIIKKNLFCTLYRALKLVVFHSYMYCKCEMLIQNAELLAHAAQNWHNFFRSYEEMAKNRRKQQKSMSLSLTSETAVEYTIWPANDTYIITVCWVMKNRETGEKVLCFAQKTESDGTVGCDIMDDRVNGKPLHQPVELLGG